MTKKDKKIEELEERIRRLESMVTVQMFKPIIEDRPFWTSK